MEIVQPLREKLKVDGMKKVLSSNKRDFLMFVLGINCSLRISDILRLSVSHVLNEKGKPRDYFELRERKTGKFRRIVLADNVQKAVMEYLKGYDGDLNRPLFVSKKSNTDGNPKAFSRQQAYNILNDAAKLVRVDEAIGCHSLRKTFGYYAYKAGTDLVLLQQIFNHSTPSITLRYIGIVQDDIDNVIINLNL